MVQYNKFLDYNIYVLGQWAVRWRLKAHGTKRYSWGEGLCGGEHASVGAMQDLAAHLLVAVQLSSSEDSTSAEVHQQPKVSIFRFGLRTFSYSTHIPSYSLHASHYSLHSFSVCTLIFWPTHTANLCVPLLRAHY